eukprot:gene10213-9033_t
MANPTQARPHLARKCCDLVLVGMIGWLAVCVMSTMYTAYVEDPEVIVKEEVDWGLGLTWHDTVLDSYQEEGFLDLMVDITWFTDTDNK